MSADIVRLVQTQVGNGVTLDADKVLEENKGIFTELVICGFDEEGELAVCGTHGIRDTAWILQNALHSLIEMGKEPHV